MSGANKVEQEIDEQIERVRRSLPTIGRERAAALLRMSEQEVSRKAKAGIIPGARMGREWVFIEADLLECIRTKAKEIAEAGTADAERGRAMRGALNGNGTLAERLARERRERQRARETQP